jgi:hypothetical protein
MIYNTQINNSRFYRTTVINNMIMYSKKVAAVLLLVLGFSGLYAGQYDREHKIISEGSGFAQNGIIQIIDKLSGAVIIKDAATVFSCNGKQYSTADMKLIGQSSSAVTTTMGKGKMESSKYVAEDGMLFGVEVVYYDDNGWVTVNGWMKNTKKTQVTFDYVNLIESSDGFAIKGDWKNTRVLGTHTLQWLKDKFFLCMV